MDSTNERITILEVCYKNVSEDIKEIKEEINKISDKIDNIAMINNKQNENIAKHSATLEHEGKNIYWIMGIVAGVASGVGTALITTLMRR
jgi:septal ring factor EnvC (AmiA/AmiB activator)